MEDGGFRMEDVKEDDGVMCRVFMPRVESNGSTMATKSKGSIGGNNRGLPSIY